jgi:hypothetical protein
VEAFQEFSIIAKANFLFDLFETKVRFGISFRDFLNKLWAMLETPLTRHAAIMMLRSWGRK